MCIRDRGSKGKIRLKPGEIDEVLNYGAQWAVENGYGWERDLEHLEEGGRMEDASADKVSDKAKKRGIPQLGSLGSGNHFLEVQRVDEIFDNETARIFGVSQDVAAGNLQKAFPGLSFDHQDYHLDVNKVSFVMRSDIHKAELEDEFGDFFRIGIWNIFGKGRDFGDFTQKHVNKASAIAILLDKLSLNRDDTFAFGDSFNDIEMLQYCQTGIAMGNAADDLKAVADYVTSDVSDKGIFNAFKQFGLI
jgi:hydroxymethylpyrimidine pyrophosphatase-like HAD family hydrolase